VRRLLIGMAQINTAAGDFAGNSQKILHAIKVPSQVFIRALMVWLGGTT